MGPCCEACRMQRAGNKLLAGATFAIDQDAAVRRRGHGNLLTQSLHRNAVADDLVAVAQLAAQQLIFTFEAALLNSVANRNHDLLKRERLLDEIESAQLGGPHGCLDGAVT